MLRKNLYGINSICLLLLISFGCVGSSLLSEKYTEKLEIFQLRSSSSAPKSLWHFTFDFQSDFSLENHITYEAIPSRSVLENIFLHSNTSDLRIEIANGKPNDFLLDQGSFYFSLPKEGKTVYANEFAHWGDLMYQIQEIFSLSVQQLTKKNYYKYKNEEIPTSSNQTERRDKFPNYESSFVYGSDPSDYICSDFIEKMKAFFPCKGSKGLFTKLSAPAAFSSDYISSLIGLHYDKESNRAYFKAEVNIIGDNDLLNSSEKYSECHRYESSQLVDYRSLINPSKDYERFDISEDSFLLYKIDSLPGDLYSKNILSSRRYITNARFEFEAKLIHELTNSHATAKVKAVFYEYFLNHQIHPTFHKISLLLNGKEEVEKRDRFEIEYVKGKYSLVKFKVEIPSNSTLKVEIPFEKLLKPFENYPHDPSRGEDLIPSVILYSTDQGKVHKVVSDNLLVELPHSDFSMPFTIIAIIMSIIGFLSMNIYRAIFENPKKIEKSKLSKIKEKIQDKCLKRYKDKKD